MSRLTAAVCDCSDALRRSNTISIFSRHVHPHDDDSEATRYDFVGDDDSVEI
jgi:hypothetical protein